LGRAAARVHILKGVSLSLAAGQATGLVGPSGSGKSTLLMTMAGLERPDSGLVKVAGQDLGALDEDGLALFRRRNVGIVFQAFHLIPTMTALENVAIPLEFAGDADAWDKARAALASVGLSHRTTHYPGQMSGGEQQRTALARAFVAQPALLLADEPTGNLDATTGHSIVDLMFDLKDRLGTALLLITHDAKLAARCGRAVRMDDGKLSPAPALLSAAQ
jgi:putative ABC transport system ATP-binding protein